MKRVPVAVVAILLDLGSDCASTPGTDWVDPHGGALSNSEPDR